MNKQSMQIGVLILSAAMALPACAASNNASQASKHSTLAAGHSVVAGTKVVSGAVAAPLVITGKIGEAAGKAGDAMMDYALTDEPLEVSEETIVAQPDPAPRQMKSVREQGGI
ncbi:hypothetical protein [Gilvimarinus xylanilyticus]|uniref:Lipoprotein n=1 Tax=Gilvimarinus xylanilyticus TaxID=2944139 RepID=A0A9X2I0U7_9GAMM|nr:hypothetical protein [Gilvimarinus xylanilyticus]MCP8898131.1 hypothetical protein [Gilvimarinus xylanilyticus]